MGKVGQGGLGDPRQKQRRQRVVGGVRGGRGSSPALCCWFSLLQHAKKKKLTHMILAAPFLSLSLFCWGEGEGERLNIVLVLFGAQFQLENFGNGGNVLLLLFCCLICSERGDMESKDLLSKEEMDCFMFCLCCLFVCIYIQFCWFWAKFLPMFRSSRASRFLEMITFLLGDGLETDISTTGQPVCACAFFFCVRGLSEGALFLVVVCVMENGADLMLKIQAVLFGRKALV